MSDRPESWGNRVSEQATIILTSIGLVTLTLTVLIRLCWHLPPCSSALSSSPGSRNSGKLAPGKPVIIAETGAYPGPGMAARIGGLLAGAKAEGLTAVVYFDRDGHKDWRVERAGIARGAFHSAVATATGN